LPEVVEDSSGGLVYRTGKELLAALKRLSGSPAPHGTGKKGYRPFLRFWRREAHVKMCLELLETAADRKFGERPGRLGYLADS
jgi:hypothetical protein